MYIISEKINGMFRKVGKAISERDENTIRDIARIQLDSGAAALDLNVGTAAEDPAKALVWLVKTVRKETDAVLSLDNPKFEVLAAGVEACGNNCIINSTTGKESDLDRFLTLTAESGAGLIALTLDEKGVPSTVEGRVEIAARVLTAAEGKGIAPEKIYLDPVTLPVNVAQDQPKKLLETIRQFKLLCDPPPHILIGLSNLSQGAKEKSLLNSTFLAMAMGAGLDAVILNPEDSLLMNTLITAGVLLNNTVYNDDYLKAWRA